MTEALAEPSRAEDGTIDCRVAIDAEDPNPLRFLERYEDEAALGAHTEADHFEEFAAVLSDLLDGEPEVLRFDGSEATAL